MPRSHGWSVLAEKALELAALALSVRVMERPGFDRLSRPSMHQDDTNSSPPSQTRHPELAEGRAEPAEATDPLAFIKETQVPGTRYYRASDDRGEVYAAFYADGRVRIASGQRRYAGVVDAGRAELLDVENNGWSELFVRTTPDNRLQLELRGGMDDARILNCDEII